MYGSYRQKGVYFPIYWTHDIDLYLIPSCSAFLIFDHLSTWSLSFTLFELFFVDSAF